MAKSSICDQDRHRLLYSLYHVCYWYDLEWEREAAAFCSSSGHRTLLLFGSIWGAIMASTCNGTTVEMKWLWLYQGRAGFQKHCQFNWLCY